MKRHMKASRDDRRRAREIYRYAKIDDDATISIAEGGVWVSAWVWVEADPFVDRELQPTIQSEHFWRYGEDVLLRGNPYCWTYGQALWWWSCAKNTMGWK